MTSSNALPVLVVLGTGPGLGMSVARAFGRRGYRVALASRSADRHAGYLDELRGLGIEAAAFQADVTVPGAVTAVVERVREDFGRIDVAYFGAATPVVTGPITDLDPTGATEALATVAPAVEFAQAVLPELRARAGALVFVGGLSAVVPMPHLGALALVAAAYRAYALNLHAALRPEGVYAGTLTVGGMIDGGDIAAATRANAPEQDLTAITLRPDDLAERVWRMTDDRTDGEVVVDVIS
ncbi:MULTISPECIES: SDR family NAD(P)-dependent oxidoreductase [Tsukamurella]|uniref:SDR family NAD(P)-dependent oxidoreductase n=2 Tax=Tsukamurella TaxID=2060 RepID=A0A5C5RZL6_9ACTN|nr:MULTISPECIES: SDR family NAD(P)-dependent oxidoreductase [Tsukamurella]NMD54201.1 SDR family NAD(P)-dependent oxidoreductase [Tsukamurella columbiensis]TWS28274.1 SDR family NAD(P)-dependent oxidoreductase [Tsukamurella conjunctivitidis]